jgi:hypothetical protein
MKEEPDLKKEITEMLLRNKPLNYIPLLQTAENWISNRN